MSGILIVCGSLLLFGTGCTQKKMDENEYNVLYSMGMTLGQRVSHMYLTDQEKTILLSGFEEAINSVDGQNNLLVDKVTIQEYYQKKALLAAQIRKKKGHNFLSGLTKKGYEKTETGLWYKIIKEGNKKRATTQDYVKVNIVGYRVNGRKVFSTLNLGKAISFQLSGAISGWMEGIQLIGESGKIALGLPSDLAYGDYGDPPRVLGGEPLMYEIELIQIHNGTE